MMVTPAMHIAFEPEGVTFFISWKRKNGHVGGREEEAGKLDLLYAASLCRNLPGESISHARSTSETPSGRLF